ncbi:hypothetical protein N7497_012027 [Penicillium chrysogenum]|uniref:Uncharacterized protein n=1 Tax=Penicillium chrysogenum TaxID=5076 RepID=A0ABQ8WTC2_PENCH|nr:hypothetical protein N7505_000193 [Penicillium chrysogenum]KAJ5282214.1 hypothetical protein N7505_000194 [Penicillium chrysogenum]KAJ6141133.1 hypothetical protein N7497_012026 [Penicillium chrysogenum]KAJ6141134.1 hypothetical protein N7497_012027 [Penicillium chrysogenum]
MPPSATVSSWEWRTLHDLLGAGTVAQTMPSTWSACWTRSRNNAPAPGRRDITSRGLAIQHNSYHLRVQQADHATTSNRQLLGVENIT